MEDTTSPLNMLAMKTFVEKVCEYVMITEVVPDKTMYTDRTEELETLLQTMKKIRGFDKYKDELVKRLQST